MLSHLDGKAVIVCDGCHTVIEQATLPQVNLGFISGVLSYLAKNGDGDVIEGHICKANAECAEKFKANALKVRKAVPQEVEHAAA